jgi:L-ascorbate metabolism protein UlaG (beta-lactamase superfamily)
VTGVADPEHLTYLGHATVLLEVEGFRLITDPVLRNTATFLRRLPHAADADSFTDVDVALISHLHHDHLDLPSIRALRQDAVVVVPHGAAHWLRAKRVDHEVVELAVGESFELGPLRVTATRAVHSGKREPFGPTASALGYLIEAGPALVYFAGDTALFPGMGQLTAPGTLDVALLPVWGWGPNLGPGHLDPGRAAEAVRLLEPRYAVPIHWGTLAPIGMHRMKLSRLYDPPHEFAAAVAAAGIPTRVLVSQPGERVEFDA